MSKLKELKNSILADGIIDEQEVKQLREILYEDGKIDYEEAEFIFELNDAVSDKSNHESWKTFFIDVISDFLLKDEISPGIIDEEEAEWLIAKVTNDGQIDTNELALLHYLNKKTELPQTIKKLLD